MEWSLCAAHSTQCGIHAVGGTASRQQCSRPLPPAVSILASSNLHRNCTVLFRARVRCAGCRMKELSSPLTLQQRPAVLASAWARRHAGRRTIAKPPHASAGQGGEPMAVQGGGHRHLRLPAWCPPGIPLYRPALLFDFPGAGSALPPPLVDNLLVRVAVGALTEALRLAGVGCAAPAPQSQRCGGLGLSASPVSNAANTSLYPHMHPRGDSVLLLQ